jgi:hypothetical protein
MASELSLRDKLNLIHPPSARINTAKRSKFADLVLFFQGKHQGEQDGATTQHSTRQGQAKSSTKRSTSQDQAKPAEARSRSNAPHHQVINTRPTKTGQ